MGPDVYRGRSLKSTVRTLYLGGVVKFQTLALSRLRISLPRDPMNIPP
jgi:hypothetical protein